MFTRLFDERSQSLRFSKNFAFLIVFWIKGPVHCFSM